MDYGTIQPSSASPEISPAPSPSPTMSDLDHKEDVEAASAEVAQRAPVSEAMNRRIRRAVRIIAVDTI